MSAPNNLDSLFDDTPRLIKTARECHDLLARLREEAKTDPTRSSVPTIVAKHFNLPLADAIELIDFTNNDLGEVEAAYIAEKVSAFVDDAGNTIDPYSQITL